jgi:hypothetical protein
MSGDNLKMESQKMGHLEYLLTMMKLPFQMILKSQTLEIRLKVHFLDHNNQIIPS